MCQVTLNMFLQTTIVVHWLKSCSLVADLPRPQVRDPPDQRAWDHLRPRLHHQPVSLQGGESGAAEDRLGQEGQRRFLGPFQNW